MTNPNNGLVGLWVITPDPDIVEYGQVTAAVGNRYSSRQDWRKQILPISNHQVTLQQHQHKQHKLLRLRGQGEGGGGVDETDDG
jgi:hypothetical protein